AAPPGRRIRTPAGRRAGGAAAGLQSGESGNPAIRPFAGPLRGGGARKTPIRSLLRRAPEAFEHRAE
ncbi:hypothetical protein, partial [Burkholderia pseudomallei]|uniref:hypothetical protein n=1 Tax=Burkholderia pseudomallei TaxID=28450 RepID=UPI001C3DA2DC